MVLAAGVLRIPAALLEADAQLGLANRLAAPFAKRVFCAFPLEGLEGPKYRVVGRPIPARSRAPDGAEARASFGLPRDGPVVLVFGGSQGARRLNEAALEAFAQSGPAILHLAGERDFPELERRPRRDDYRLLAFTDEFGAALAAADLVVARAGRLGLGGGGRGQARAARPVPARDRRPPDEERRLLRARGGAVVVPEAELDLRRQVEELLGTPSGSPQWGRRCSRWRSPMPPTSSPRS